MEPPSQVPVAPRLIGIASSHCGLEPLEVILGGLPREFPVPILVVPSIHPHYVNRLAARLGENILLKVVAAEDGQMPAPGCVYLAADDPGLLIVYGRLRLGDGKPNDKRRVKDALFCAMAWDQGSGALAVILDGMGRDGALGMKEVRSAGGYTIVQDRSTSVVHGTAQFAVEINAACESLPVHEIAPRLVALVATSPPNLNP